MNPGNPEWRAFASQAISSEVVGPEANGFDGVFLDNVELKKVLASVRRETARAGASTGSSPLDMFRTWRSVIARRAMRGVPGEGAG